MTNCMKKQVFLIQLCHKWKLELLFDFAFMIVSVFFLLLNLFPLIGTMTENYRSQTKVNRLKKKNTQRDLCLDLHPWTARGTLHEGAIHLKV